jgi:hypothetical protein
MNKNNDNKQQGVKKIIEGKMHKGIYMESSRGPQ